MHIIDCSKEFSSIRETSGLDFKLVGRDKSRGTFIIKIGNTRYEYKSTLPRDYDSYELADKVVKIFTRSSGKALAFIKRNSILVK